MFLCGLCERITLASLKSDTGYVHHTSWKALGESSRQCRLCQIIRLFVEDVQRTYGSDACAHITSPPPGRTTEDDSEPLHLQVASARDGQYLRLSRCGRSHEDWPGFPKGAFNHLHMLKIENGRSKSAKLAEELTDPDVAIAAGAHWLAMCAQGHSFCNYPFLSTHTVLPKRMIDVRLPEDAREPCLTDQWDSSAPYVALSHCWGKSPMLTTTRATLEARMREIPIKTLPKTFNDATYITRKLQFQYLWIDSLCIIQDCQEDWGVESSKMASIYEAAHLTIAAAASGDSNGGCFFPKELLTPIQLQDERAPSNEEKSGPAGSEFSIRFCPTDSVRFMNPLRYRGWALQEALLSRRLLIFEAGRLRWECGEASTDHEKRHIDVMLPRESHTNLFRAGPSFKVLLRYPTRSMQDFPASNLWYTMMEEYSRRKLTYLSDKLPALAGLTIMYQECTEAVPLAGLWKGDLHHGLLWQCASYAATQPQELASTPSWSWLSIHGEVMWPKIKIETEFRRKAKVLDARLDWTGAKLVSSVVRGTLLISGALCKIVVKPNYSLSHKVTACEIWACNGKTGQPQTRNTVTRSIGTCVLDHGLPATQIWCLQVCTRELQSSKREWVDNVLLLVPTNPEASHYQRIGAGQIDAESRIFHGLSNVEVTLV